MNIEHEELRNGWIEGIGCCFCYKVMIDQPISPFNIRLHHYQIGIGILLYAIHKKSSYWIGFGLGLLVDDIKDLIYDVKELVKKLQNYLKISK
jgi:hypothetical protein